MLTKSDVKYIQSLSQKKFRTAENLFIAEGPKIVAEALLAGNGIVKKIIALPQWVQAHKHIQPEAAWVVVNEPVLSRISQLTTPNQVLALVALPPQQKAEIYNGTWALALDGIQDPGNLGTIIRIADWFGITQIICSPDCADAYSHKVVQATMGSIFRVQIFYTPLAAWLQAQSGVAVYGAALNGMPLSSCSKIDSGIIVIGNESKGISDAVMQQVQQKITIEKKGRAESLNAAVAAGIILSHIA